MSNTSKVTPRRTSNSTASQPMEYDDNQTPVLIRLPDLSAAPGSVSGSAEVRTATAHQASSRNGRAGRKRRIDASHAASRPQRGRPLASWDGISKSRITLAAVVLVVAGITYSLVPSGGSPDQESQPAVDSWAIDQSTSDPSAKVQVAMPSTDSSADLWPEKSKARTAQSPPPLKLPPEFEPRQSVARGPAQSQSETSQDISLSAPSGQAASFQAAGSNETPGFDHNRVTPVVIGVAPSDSAPRVSNQMVNGWPESSQSSAGEADAFPAYNSPPTAHDGTRPQLQTGAPTTPVYSPPVYPTAPSHRTGRRQLDTSRAAAGVDPQSGARLEGTIRFPRPSSSDEPRRTLR